MNVKGVKSVYSLRLCGNVSALDVPASECIVTAPTKLDSPAGGKWYGIRKSHDYLMKKLFKTLIMLKDSLNSLVEGVTLSTAPPSVDTNNT